MWALQDISRSPIPPPQHLRDSLASVDHDAVGHKSDIKLADAGAVDPVVAQVWPLGRGVGLGGLWHRVNRHRNEDYGWLRR